MSKRSRRDDQGPDIRSFAAARLTLAGRTLQAQRAEVLAGDPAAVHRARVALRRLRSDLRVLHVFERDRVAALDAEARDLLHLLGAVRDRDVIARRIAERAVDLPADERVTTDAVLARLRAERATAVRRVQAPPATERYDALVDALLACSAEPPLRATCDPTSPVAPVLQADVRRALRKNQRRAAQLPRAASAAEIHALRKATKQTRYAAEALHDITGRERHAQVVRDLTKVQDRLGAHQDDAVASRWLHAVATESAGSTIGFGAGLLVHADASTTTERPRRSTLLRRLDPRRVR